MTTGKTGICFTIDSFLNNLKDNNSSTSISEDTIHTLVIVIIFLLLNFLINIKFIIFVLKNTII